MGMELIGNQILQADMSQPIVIPISEQNLDLSTTLETVVANDVGMPVTIFMQKPDLLSLLGNFTFVIEGKKISIHTNLGLRYLAHRSQGMIGLNPSIGIWQGVTRSRSQDFYLPIENTFYVDVEKQTAGLVFEWKEHQAIVSGLSHMHTITYVMGPVKPLMPLEVFCTDCDIIHIVSTGTPQNVTQAKTKLAGSQFEYDMNIFDCENPDELEGFDLLWDRITSEDNKNVRTSENNKYVLGLIEVSELTDRLPSTGSCGQSTRVMAVGKARKLEMTVTVEEKQTVGDIQYKDGDGKAIHSWHWTYESSENSPDGKCPQQTGSQVLISGSSTPRKPRNNEAMTECEEERGKNRLYPATENCVKAAEHSVFARNVTINVQTSNAARLHLMEDVIEVTPSKTSSVLVNGEAFHTLPEDNPLK
ncbi:hypothetical protein B566_EDAN011931 [Ephemera danica]|nr:hypothetical protein B566_EDAN011931 [Ephemera danica]